MSRGGIAIVGCVEEAVYVRFMYRVPMSRPGTGVYVPPPALLGVSVSRLRTPTRAALALTLSIGHRIGHARGKHYFYIPLVLTVVYPMRKSQRECSLAA